MLGLYWGCLIFGVLLALVAVVFGDLLSHMNGAFHFMSGDHLQFLQPMVLVGGITVFGGSGILFTQYSELTALVVVPISIIIAFLVSLLVYFFYVRPMENTENSTGFSLRDLEGRIAEVSVTIPKQGYGEVVLKLISGFTNEIAASFDREEIAAGTKVTVVEVRDSTLYVSPLDL